MTGSAKQRPVPPPQALHRKTEDTGRFRIASAQDARTLLPPPGASGEVVPLEAIGGTLEIEDATEAGVTAGPPSGVFRSGERAEFEIADLSLSLDNPFLASSLVPPPRKPLPIGKALGVAVALALVTVGAALAARALHEQAAPIARSRAESTPVKPAEVATTIVAPVAPNAIGAATAARQPATVVAAEPAKPVAKSQVADSAASATATSLHTSDSIAPVAKKAPSAALVESSAPATQPAQTEHEATPKVAAETVTRSPLTEAPAAGALTPSSAPVVAQQAAEPSSPSADVVAATATVASSSDENGALPETPSRDDVINAFTRIQPELSACTQGKHGLTSVDATVVNTGRVARALVDGVFKGTPEGSCIARAVRSASFPRFSQPSLRVSYPLSL